ncbi:MULTISPECIES: hypothetical protein [Dyella]|uniref:Uncharacterized protein n=2 Tax=Dyella TaxID=231454 RepID=A0A4R0YDQ4_9GAMM|nr:MULTISPECIES: hypothetical protein [Dyella]TBR36075.1 hypothetical protein EYV96_15825 [Dyella terrae]TCI06124.1 hypothetical protein EZM97_34915 [Dyella soli]
MSKPTPVPKPSPFRRRLRQRLKRLSISGTVLACVYLCLAVACVIHAIQGGQGVLFALQIISLPISALVLLVLDPLAEVALVGGLNLWVINVVVVAIEIVLCTRWYYFIGKQLGRLFSWLGKLIAHRNASSTAVNHQTRHGRMP